MKILLRPNSAQSPASLGDSKDTSFCNITEDISVTDPRKGICPMLFMRRLCNNNRDTAGKQHTGCSSKLTGITNKVTETMPCESCNKHINKRSTLKGEEVKNKWDIQLVL